MSDVLLIVILLVSTATSTLTIRVLRSSRRSERFGEDHHELLLNQQDQLRLLREGQEHQRLIEKLEKERKERSATQQQLERLEQQLSEREQHLLERKQKERLATQQRQRLVEELEREREAHLDTQQQLERLEQRLSVREQEERLATQQQLERLEQQLLPLEQQRQRLEEELSKLHPLPGKHQADLLGTYRSWRRKYRRAAEEASKAARSLKGARKAFVEAAGAAKRSGLSTRRLAELRDKGARYLEELRRTAEEAEGERAVSYGAAPKESGLERSLHGLGESSGKARSKVPGTAVVLTLVVASLFALAAVFGTLHYGGPGVQTSGAKPPDPSPPSEKVDKGSRPGTGDEEQAPKEADKREIFLGYYLPRTTTTALTSPLQMERTHPSTTVERTRPTTNRKEETTTPITTR